MELTSAIAAINAAPISQEQKNAIIEKLILDAYAATPVVDPAIAQAAAAKAAQAANVEALSHVRPDMVARGSADIDPYVIEHAKAYRPDTPTADEAKYGPLPWAMRQYIAAGLPADMVNAPNGPLYRLSGEGADATHPETWIPAWESVLNKYVAGSAAIDADHQARLDADVQRSAGANIPGIGFPVWDKATVDKTLAGFDAATSEEAKYNGALRGASKRGISNEEFIALQNRGMSVVAINQAIERNNN